MAENKKSFILYADLLSMVERLPKEKAGELFVMILEYVNDKHPKTDDLLLQIAFEPIKLQLKRDLKQWVDKIEDKSRSGRMGNLKRWHNDLYLQVLDFQLTLEEAEFIAKSRKVSHTDEVPSQSIANVAVTVNDNVTVTDNDIVIKKKKKEKIKIFTPPTLFDVEEYFKENGYKTECAKKAFNFYDCNDWIDSKGNKVKSWKQKMQGVWFKDENKITINPNTTQQTSDEALWQKFLDLEKTYVIQHQHLYDFYPNRYEEMLQICESGKIERR